MSREPLVKADLTHLSKSGPERVRCFWRCWHFFLQKKSLNELGLYWTNSFHRIITNVISDRRKRSRIHWTIRLISLQQIQRRCVKQLRRLVFAGGDKRHLVFAQLHVFDYSRVFPYTVKQLPGLPQSKRWKGLNLHAILESICHETQNSCLKRMICLRKQTKICAWNI